MTATTDVFEAQRAFLFGIAYRMLGSVSDAEDVVQDAWLRWQGDRPADLAQPRAWLARVVTHLSIDLLRRRRRERVDYTGPWLPEPLLEPAADDGADAADHAALAETLSIGLLALLEALPPTERATFVLREAFGMDYEAIGAILEAQPTTCRQWFRRGRARLAARDHDAAAGRAGRALLDRFLAALASGDATRVAALLGEDVELVSDGGGKAAAASRPLHGRRAVSRFLAGLAARADAAVRVAPARLNGAWGCLVYRGAMLETAVVLSGAADAVRGIYLVRNPDKLARLHAAARSAAQSTQHP
ncbi:MAG: RNA polymerase sigma factor SigJ [Gammaproteobacteria bacterium]|nr:RNA polymerase sigma factor SigJ [Gammaproteobacteria bacterium]MCP5198776.1 RNA polymerase sigma factor SigJ [Gammaproteobacteria bacterium]